MTEKTNFGDLPPAHRPLLCAVITLGALLAAPVARAQSGQYLHLSPGDALTVSGAGTVGKLGGSTYNQPSANSYTGYSSFADTVDNYGNFTLGSGGSITDPRNQSSFYGILTQGNGIVSITGGSVTVGNSATALGATDSSRVTITGGTITSGSNGYDVYAFGGNTVLIGGGVFTVGQGGTALGSSAASTIDLFGTNFSYTYAGKTNPITSGLLPSNGAGGTITGTLLNGDRLNTTWFNDSVFEVNVGTPPVVATAVPEASSLLLLGLGSLALGLLTVRRRTGTAAAS